MDFGVGFLSNNVMLPILDFCYGIIPSYGLAIVALTFVIRFALYPVSAGQIRNMRRMRVAQPVMQKRQQEIRERYKSDPVKLQEEQAKLIQEFGNPLAGCFPLLIQMPVLFALFATLRGSPFAASTYSINLQILPPEKVAQIEAQPFSTKPQSIYVADGEHYPVAAVLDKGNRLAVGQAATLDYQTVSGKPLSALLAEHPDVNIQPTWTVQKGQDRVSLDESGHLQTLQPGDVTIQGKIPGIAAENGFLFIKALGRVGAIDGELITQTEAGPKLNVDAIHWDILLMVLGFGISLYINQLLTGQQQAANNAQQQAVNQYLPIIFSGMFLFFPLPSGVLLYMLIGNIFQTVQSAILAREPLPENLQKILDEEERKAKTKTISKENEIFALETGSSVPKASDAKPSGFRTAAADAARPSEEGGGLFGSVKARFQEALAEVQAAEQAKRQGSSEAAHQTIDVKAQEVSANTPPSASKGPAPKKVAPKSASKKKRKNRAKRRSS
ncbi:MULTISPECIES: membrane protein insertase YidC [Oscillatoriophycideae]|uniref:membrane protein insertase YidC n=1 Tax=Lyngbya confervoides TaxID=207921 RepID=UPI0014087A22|nr:membrane protein insertase YidC [Lyngbya confervoides]